MSDEEGLVEGTAAERRHLKPTEHKSTSAWGTTMFILELALIIAALIGFGCWLDTRSKQEATRDSTNISLSDPGRPFDRRFARDTSVAGGSADS